MKKYASKTKFRLSAKKLIHLRAKKQWTQKRAAELAGISLPTYGNAERGLEIQAANAGRIAELYSVPLEQLEQRRERGTV